DGDEILERDPGRRAMRTRLHARRTVSAPDAQIAFARQLVSLPPELHHRCGERDHRDVVPGTVLRAELTAHARLGVDRDFKGAHCAGDRAGRAAHEARRIAALIAGDRNRPVVIFLALADEPRRAVVRVGAATHAIVAARARVQIDEEDALAVDEAG